MYTANCTVVRGLEAIEAIFFLTDDAMHIAEGYQKDEQGVLIEVGEDIFKWEYTVTLLDTSKKKVNAIRDGFYILLEMIRLFFVKN